MIEQISFMLDIPARDPSIPGISLLGRLASPQLLNSVHAEQRPSGGGTTRISGPARKPSCHAAAARAG